jgi:hypothetical protein
MMTRIPTYQEKIATMFAGQSSAIPPHHIEGWMRSERGTLDGLSAGQFRALAVSCRLTAIEAGEELSARIADSCGVRPQKGLTG